MIVLLFVVLERLRLARGRGRWGGEGFKVTFVSWDVRVFGG